MFEKTEETKETQSLAEAEQWQKSGWVLMSAVIVGTDEQGYTIKNYRFKKGNGETKPKHIFQDPFNGKEIK